MREGSMLINASRGAVVDEDALLAMLDTAHIRSAVVCVYPPPTPGMQTPPSVADVRVGHAQLDVFHKEPLHPAHPLWRHPRAIVTPHVAALTLRQPAVDQVVANLQRLARGEEGRGRVDRGRGY
jgi:phosphoglycerate dehydrogenase-like enzyme